VTPVRSTPIALLDRRRLPQWIALLPHSGAELPTPRARLLLDCLRAEGALFFDELSEASHLLRPQLEEALGELVALGLVTSDSFAGLRALLVPSNRRKPGAGVRRRGRVLPFAIESGGRWALVRRAPQHDGIDEQARAAATEHVAQTLLQRYGVVFWRLIAREATWLPPWRDLLRVYRRLEARGDIRGGRFVAGFSGEQYALPEAVGLLRQTRRRLSSEEWVSLSGADPLNLIGILTPGPRLASLTDNRLIYRDGLPVATLTAGKTQLLADLDARTRWEAEKRLIRSAARGSLAHLG
jgi:ATP-dependent Lhr-like helicase